jgi:hypothetical protein
MRAASDDAMHGSESWRIEVKNFLPLHLKLPAQAMLALLSAVIAAYAAGSFCRPNCTDE